ncbi:B92 [Murid betaherpesvirus 8]|uniref:B92 n=2 Tax=Rat cytomegalovirus (isolate England) TaxID=1261657 RepID=K7XR32_RCMVE|nr:E92 [Murid betaherpesvirus 8]AKE44260.1 a92 [Rat cytomegalovirus ALL-03]AFX83406.1 E92 [Murid betaherpesvirus 8]AKB93286.1 B92 [Murid betaherpesvirus 8]WEG71879.1 protein UL92 [Murid betaherpesvirus 8]WPH25001.1 B92 [Murid betaherpesvirus 8]
MFSYGRDSRTGKPISGNGSTTASARGGVGKCDDHGGCDMRNLCNPLTQELNIRNMYVCIRCHRTHLCDLRHDCVVVHTQDGSVCVKTGLSYGSVFPGNCSDTLEPVTESNVEEINMVGVIMAYVYTYLTRNAEHYDDVIRSVIDGPWFNKATENAIYYTFDRVFKRHNAVHKIPVSVIGQLFVQLVIGVHARVTKYDSTVIKVSRRKRVDGLLKRMRSEYGNAPSVRI